MSEGQALELKELESNFEEVLDENCRVLVKYFNRVLENTGGNKPIAIPPLKLRNHEKGGKLKHRDAEKIKTDELGILKNGRYNVMLCILYILHLFLK